MKQEPKNNKIETKMNGKSEKREIEVNQGGNHTKKLKMKQPTVEELNELHETQTLFNNNLVRLQIQELISAVEIKNKYKLKLSAWLEDFEKLIKDLPERDPLNISDISKKSRSDFERNLAKLNTITYCDQSITSTFSRPLCVDTFGLHKIEGLPGPNLEINIHITMPKKNFLTKDYLNNRYFVRKTFYLMYIADEMKSKNICSNIKCSYYYDNPLLPYLIITPMNSDKVTVNIFVVPEHDCFKGHRLLPDVNNVRANIFKPKMDVDKLAELPTSYYNASLGFDVALADNQKFITESFNGSKNIQEGLKLIVIWMNQRMFNKGLCSFSHDIVIYILTYLMQNRKINKHMSSYQVFRNFLNFMNITNLTETPISICEFVSDENILRFKNAYDVVIIDKTGFYNVASFITRDIYKKVRQECQLAFKLLDQSKVNSFGNLFLVKTPIYLQYDGIVDISDDDFNSLLKHADDTMKAKFLGNKKLLFMNVVQNFLQKGLNKRAKTIVPIMPGGTYWNYGESPKSNNRLMFGLKLDPDMAFDIIEFGPPLHDPEELAFKEFWGKLSSNRRFRDGTARIVVYFEAKTIKDKRGIIRNIIDFVLKDKLKLNYKFYYDEFEEVLLEKVKCWYPTGTNEETSLKIIQSSDELGKKIRSLDLQLVITGIVGISDIFCYSNVFPPIPTSFKCGKVLTKIQEQNIVLKNKLSASPRYVEPIECVIHLEHSSKWPSELEVFRQMKTLFYLEIAKLLHDKHNIVSSVKSSFIDILYGGLIFRYFLYITKEVGLLKKDFKENGSIRYKSNEESLMIERKLSVLPNIIGALKGIQAQYPSFGVSSCLAKRWIRSQLFDEDLLPDIVIDLLNSYQYVDRSLHDPAVAPQVAFLRFLKCLSENSWDLEPLVINFNDELTYEDISKIDSQMRSHRENFPPLFILTPYNKEESIFTRKSPTKLVLSQLKLLAREFLNVVENIVMNEIVTELKDLFIPNKQGFNCILNLFSLINPRRHQRLTDDREEKKLNFVEPNSNDDLLPIINFNPVQLYLKELRETYGGFCVFFYDSYGGDFIGVLWNPKELLPKEVKVSYMLGRKLEDGKLILDIQENMRGFRIKGKDVLKCIDVS